MKLKRLKVYEEVAKELDIPVEQVREVFNHGMKCITYCIRNRADIRIKGSLTIFVDKDRYINADKQWKKRIRKKIV